MAFSQLTIVVDGGGGTNATVVIPLPAAVVSDPNNQNALEGTSAQTMPGVGGIVQTIGKLGFWDSAGQNFYSASSIRKITPS